MTDLELYEEVVALTRRGEPFSVATVVSHRGSSPRKAGAKMLVRGDGTLLGSVGGGWVEKESVAAALSSLAAGTPTLLEFDLSEENGYACGGRMSVFVEPQGKRGELVIFGAGHVGKAVAELASRCGFRVLVVDERPEWATAAHLPGAERVICAAAGDALSSLPVGKGSFLLIATPSHRQDFEVVRLCLGTEAGFIGLLGSRRKRELLLKTLADQGVPPEERERVVTPVGIAIGAHTPEEIAVSVVAQLIALRTR